MQGSYPYVIFSWLVLEKLSRRLIMNQLQKRFSASLIALAALTAAPMAAWAAPALGMESTFAVLSVAGAVTCTDSSITGDVGCTAIANPGDNSKSKCNQGVGNGPEGCDPGNSNNNPWGSNDENGGIPGDPGRGNNQVGNR
jgi:hypothetical protein